MTKCISDSKTNSVVMCIFPHAQETRCITDLLRTWVTLSGVISLQWPQVILEGFRQVSVVQTVTERISWSYFAGALTDLGLSVFCCCWLFFFKSASFRILEICDLSCSSCNLANGSYMLWLYARNTKSL